MKAVLADIDASGAPDIPPLPQLIPQSASPGMPGLLPRLAVILAGFIGRSIPPPVMPGREDRSRQGWGAVG